MSTLDRVDVPDTCTISRVPIVKRVDLELRLACLDCSQLFDTVLIALLWGSVKLTRFRGHPFV